MRRGMPVSLLLAFVLVSNPASPGERPIIAVFDIQAKRIKLPRGMLDALTDYLASRLTETGKYQVVPRDQLKERLMEKKKSSYKHCYNKKCQIEMGRELAAEKTVDAQVSKFADVCTLSVTIYDLGKSATEAAATERGGCDEKGLLGSLDRAVNKLVGITPRPPPTVKPEIKKTADEDPAGIDWIYSKPAGIEFARSEITVAQYRACVNAGSCEKPRTKDDNKYCNWGYSGRDSHPINCVDWNQANDFCNWAGGRLPTEDEWYAEASNGGKREYPWGNQQPTCDYAVMDQGGDGCGRDSTWPVCSKRSGNSVSGLCDMSGNLWEWTSSWYGKEHKNRVVRGGSWLGGAPEGFRASYRVGNAPTYWGSHRLGFRCGRSSR